MILAFRILTITALSTAVGQDKARILNRGQNFQVSLKTQVVLPCNVTRLGDSVVVWKQGSRVIFAGQLRVRFDQRFQLAGTSLLIKSTDERDSGNYICQIETKNRKSHVYIEHHLLVEREALITGTEPAGGQLTVRSGTPRVELSCHVQGSPAPKITWTRRNRDISGMNHAANGSTLVLYNVTGATAGLYTCTAWNNVGRPAHKDIRLYVLYGPEVSVEREVVFTREGCSATITCFVSGYPTPEVKWFQNTLLLVPSRDMNIKYTGSKHELVLSNVRLNGGRLDQEYNCTATSKLGSESRQVKITGLPERPQVEDDLEYLGNSEYLLRWRSKQFSRVNRHRITYRQVKENDNERLEFGPKIVEVPASLLEEDTSIGDQYKEAGAGQPGANRKGGRQSIIHNENCDQDVVKNFSYTLHSLEFNAKYEIKVESENKHGWSEASDPVVVRTTVETEIRAKKVQTFDTFVSSSSNAGITVASAADSSLAKVDQLLFLTALAAAVIMICQSHVA